MAFNSILYLIHAIFSLCLCLTTVFPPFALVGGIGHCLGCCAHLACIIVTAVYRFSEFGNKCADSGAPVYITDDGEVTATFEDHGAAISALFIAQCVLICFYGCCVSAVSQMGFAIFSIKTMGKAPI